MKVIKVGHYRMFFILGAVASLVFFGLSQNLTVLAVSMAVISGWVIFEINVVLQTVLGVQRMVMHVIQQNSKVKQGQSKDIMKIDEPAVKLVEFNPTTNEE